MHTPEQIHEYFFGDPVREQDGVLFIKRENRLPEYEDLLEQPRHFGNVWQGVSGRLNGSNVSVVVTGVGPTMVGDCASAFYAPGAVCLYSGTCGGLGEGMHIGDMIVSSAAVAGDGFSQMHGASLLEAVSSDKQVSERVAGALAIQGFNVHTGRTFTTSSIMAEFTNPDFWDLVPDDVKGIEMGCSSFFDACQRTRKHGTAMMWVTDLPRGGKSFFDETGPEDRAAKHSIYTRLPHIELNQMGGLLQDDSRGRAR